MMNKVGTFKEFVPMNAMVFYFCGGMVQGASMQELLTPEAMLFAVR